MKTDDMLPPQTSKPSQVALPVKESDLVADHLYQDDNDDFLPPARPTTSSGEGALAALDLDQAVADVHSHSPQPVGAPTSAALEFDLAPLEIQDENPLGAPVALDAAEPNETDAPKKGGLLSRFLPQAKPKPAASTVSADAPVSEPDKQSFVQKNKAALVIGAVVIGLLVLKKQSATKIVEKPPVAQEPIEIAVDRLQEGDQNVGVGTGAAQTEAPSFGFVVDNVPAGGANSEADPFAGSETPNAATAPAGESAAQQAQANASPAQPKPADQAPVAEKAAAVAPVATPAAGSDAEKQIAKLQAENQSLRDRLAASEKLVAELQAKGAAQSKKPEPSKPEPSKPAVAVKSDAAAKPKTQKAHASAAKPEEHEAQAKPSSLSTVTAVKPATQAAEVQSPARSDVQFLGSFRSGDTVRAHALIGNNVMEVSAGQKIGGLTIESVSMEGVRINGHTYR